MEHDEIRYIRIVPPQPGDLLRYAWIAIAAVLLGGTSMAGGSGTIMGTLQGILVLGVLKNGMNLFGVAEYYQTMITGVLLVFVMLFDRYYVSRKAKTYR